MPSGQAPVVDLRQQLLLLLLPSPSLPRVDDPVLRLQLVDLAPERRVAIVRGEGQVLSLNPRPSKMALRVPSLS